MQKCTSTYLQTRRNINCVARCGVQVWCDIAPGRADANIRTPSGKTSLSPQNPRASDSAASDGGIFPWGEAFVDSAPRSASRTRKRIDSTTSSFVPERSTLAFAVVSFLFLQERGTTGGCKTLTQGVHLPTASTFSPIKGPCTVLCTIFQSQQFFCRGWGGGAAS